MLALGLFAFAVAGVMAVQLSALRFSEDAARALRAVVVATDYLQREAMVPATADGVRALPRNAPPEAHAACRWPARCTRDDFLHMQGAAWRAAIDDAAVPGARAALLPHAGVCARALPQRLTVTISWPTLVDRGVAVGPPPCLAGASGPRPFVSLGAYRGNRR